MGHLVAPPSLASSKRLLDAKQEDLFSYCQRWNGGRASYRPAGEVFDTKHAEVRLIDEASAKAFVKAEHYSRSYPAARLRVGLFVKKPFHREVLSGAAIFSVSMSSRTIPSWFPDLKASEGVELGRFVLLQEVESNAETWFQARALRPVSYTHLRAHET